MFSFISLTTFVVAGLFFSTFVYFFKNREFYRLASQFPGPFSLPIIGNAYLFLGDSEQVYKSIWELFIKFPEGFRLWLGNRFLVMFSHPEEIKTILQSPLTIEKDGLYSLMEPWLGSGLLTAKGDVWKVHRKLIQPAFNQRILLSFIGIFHKHSLNLTKKLEKEVNGKEFHVSHYLSMHLLGSIRETAMGIDDIEDENESIKYLEALEKTLETISIRIFKVWLQLDIIYKFTTLFKQSQIYLDHLHNTTDKIIRSKRRKLNDNAIREMNETSNDTSRRTKPFLDLLLQLSDEEKALSDLELRYEVDTLLFGGHDTTASTVSFALLMLASHPDIQDKVYQEIYNLFGSKSPEEVPFKPEHLQHFVYLERVIKETMRLFPVVPILLRRATNNIKIGEYIVPKDTTVIIPVAKINRDEKFWTNPLTFNPDRFSPEEVAKRHPYAYLPFSGGPRNCIGQSYAMMSMKAMIISILRVYIVKKDQIQPIKDIRLKLDTLLRPVEPISVRIEKRNGD